MDITSSPVFINQWLPQYYLAEDERASHIKDAKCFSDGGFGVGAVRAKMKKNNHEWTNQGEKEKYCTGKETPIEASIPRPGISASAGEDTS